MKTLETDKSMTSRKTIFFIPFTILETVFGGTVLLDFPISKEVRLSTQ